MHSIFLLRGSARRAMSQQACRGAVALSLCLSVSLSLCLSATLPLCHSAALHRSISVCMSCGCVFACVCFRTYGPGFSLSVLDCERNKSPVLESRYLTGGSLEQGLETALLNQHTDSSATRDEVSPVPAFLLLWHVLNFVVRQC